MKEIEHVLTCVLKVLELASLDGCQPCLLDLSGLPDPSALFKVHLRESPTEHAAHVRCSLSFTNKPSALVRRRHSLIIYVGLTPFALNKQALSTSSWSAKTPDCVRPT